MFILIDHLFLCIIILVTYSYRIVLISNCSLGMALEVDGGVLTNILERD
jgi:hypothetical protein